MKYVYYWLYCDGEPRRYATERRARKSATMDKALFARIGHTPAIAIYKQTLTADKNTWQDITQSITQKENQTHETQ